MNTLILLPVASLKIAMGCIESIDSQFHRHLHIVNNSGESFDDAFFQRFDCFVHTFAEQNIGVARSWNEGIKEMFARKYSYMLIVSASMRFRDGARGVMSWLDEHPDEYGLFTQHGWHCAAIAKKTVERVGLFDVNFYPAYFEDSDYIRRMELAGIHEPCDGTRHIPGITIDAESIGDAMTIKTTDIRVNHAACGRYFVKKWGAMPSYKSKKERDLMYSYPFNDAKNDLSYFPDTLIEQLKKEYGLS